VQRSQRAHFVDGAMNNDDTVGGLLQLFPLDAIEEFQFSISSYNPEYGGGSGGVMHVVTKSGTNRLAGSAFSFFRDAALNARTTTEENAGVPKSDYRRWQYGGSVGGPIVPNAAHFFRRPGPSGEHVSGGRYPGTASRARRSVSGRVSRVSLTAKLRDHEPARSSRDHRCLNEPPWTLSVRALQTGRHRTPSIR
jgi:hypothetical protein